MKSVYPEPPSDLELEILDTLWSDRETVATVLSALSNPDNVDRFSAAAKALDRADLDAVLHRLRDLGLVVGHEEPGDGYQVEAGRTYAWWSMTAGSGSVGRRARRNRLGGARRTPRRC